MLCNEKRPWADWFLLRATACCLQAPAGAAGQLPQLWLLHRFIERSLKALTVLMLLTICCRFPRWTFLKYFLHIQFDSREAWRTSTTFSRRLGPTLARLPQIVGFSLSSFWGFQVELTIFHKSPILDPPVFAAKADSFDPSAPLQPNWAENSWADGCFQQCSSKFCCILSLHYTSLPDWFSCESRRTRKLIEGVFCPLRWK